MPQRNGLNFVALPPWKKKRRLIGIKYIFNLNCLFFLVQELITTNFYSFEVFKVPSNRIRSHVIEICFFFLLIKI